MANDRITQQLLITGKEQVSNEYRKAGTASERFNKTLGRQAKAFALTALKTLAAVVAVRQLVNITRDAIRFAAAQEKAEISLGAALRATGQFTEKTLQSIKDYAKELQDLTGVGDEVTLAAAAQIQALAQLSSEDLPKAIKATFQLKAIMGGEGGLKDAATLVAKAISSTVNPLTRYGIEIELTGTKTDRLGRVLKATEVGWRIIQEEAGSAATALKVVESNWGDLLEALGRTLISSGFINQLRNITDQFNDIADALERGAGAIEAIRLSAGKAAVREPFIRKIQETTDIEDLRALAAGRPEDLKQAANLTEFQRSVLREPRLKALAQLQLFDVAGKKPRGILPTPQAAAVTGLGGVGDEQAKAEAEAKKRAARRADFEAGLGRQFAGPGALTGYNERLARMQGFSSVEEMRAADTSVRLQRQRMGRRGRGRDIIAAGMDLTFAGRGSEDFGIPGETTPEQEAAERNRRANQLQARQQVLRAGQVLQTGVVSGGRAAAAQGIGVLGAMAAGAQGGVFGGPVGIVAGVAAGLLSGLIGRQKRPDTNKPVPVRIVSIDDRAAVQLQRSAFIGGRVGTPAALGNDFNREIQSGV